jgi:SAM-dependent methyltransferase
MRREQLFSKGGFYDFIVESNALMHREAIDRGIWVSRQLAARGRIRLPMRVLDLACGGQPVIIAGIMHAMPECRFDYTGIDINPDQIANARRFHFPDNVAGATLIEGSAWDFRGLALQAPFDLVFSGMNLHHGTPDELYVLALQLRKLMSSDAVFISHDWYCPNGEPYQARPAVNPDDPDESFRLLEPDVLAAAGVPDFGVNVYDGTDSPAWRTAYASGLRDVLLERGADPEGAQSTFGHVLQRDYPVSTDDFCRIFREAGFCAQVLSYDESIEPLAAYIHMPVASRAPLDWLQFGDMVRRP